MNLHLLHPAEEIVLTMNRIYTYGMTTTSGGNLSILDDDGSVWISPKGVDKGNLRPEDVMRISPDGKIHGIHEASTEYPFHLAIYKARPDIKAVLHAHPPSLIAFSIVREIPDTRIIPKARDVCGEVGYAHYALPGSKKLGENLAIAFSKGFDTVLMENHGIATAGTSLTHAFQRLETLDFCARLWIKAKSLGPVHLLENAHFEMVRKFQSVELPEFDRFSISSKEKKLRHELRSFLSRCYDRQLVTSTEGSFSVRLDADSFLITPYNQDRKYMDESDMVLIHKGKREKGSSPSKSALLHQRIYQDHPEIGALLVALPPNAMAFGVSDVEFDTRTIPECYIVLRDIRKFPFGIQYDDIAQLSSHLSLEHPVVICKNDCLLVAGKTLLDGFDRLEVAEYSAKAILASRVLGPMKPIEKSEIDEINRVFLGKS